MRSEGWDPNPTRLMSSRKEEDGRCPRGRSVSTPIRTQRKRDMRTQGEGRHLQATKRGLTRHQPRWHLVRGLLLFKLPGLRYFVMAARADCDRAQARSKLRAGVQEAKLPPGFYLLSQLLLKLSCQNSICDN